MTPILEQLVLNNKAEYKIHNHGISGAGTVDIPDGKTAVVTKIVWHPFIDLDEVENLFNQSIGPDSPPVVKTSCLHTLSLSNEKNTYNMTFKDSFNGMWAFDDLGGQIIFFDPAPPTELSSYYRFTGKIQIDIRRFLPYSEWVMSSGTLQPESQERPVPLGYGKAGDALTEPAIVMSFPNGVAPPALPYNPLGTRAGVVSAFGEIFDFIGLLPLRLKTRGVLDPPENNVNVDTFPIVQIHYVELNEKYTNDLDLVLGVKDIPKGNI